MIKKEKLGICIICGEVSPQSELGKIQEYDEESGESGDSVGWAHEKCFRQMPEIFEGAGPDDHGDDWKNKG